MLNALSLQVARHGAGLFKQEFAIPKAVRDGNSLLVTGILLALLGARHLLLLLPGKQLRCLSAAQLLSALLEFHRARKIMYSS